MSAYGRLDVERQEEELAHQAAISVWEDIRVGGNWGLSGVHWRPFISWSEEREVYRCDTVGAFMRHSFYRNGWVRNGWVHLCVVEGCHVAGLHSLRRFGKRRWTI